MDQDCMLPWLLHATMVTACYCIMLHMITGNYYYYLDAPVLINGHQADNYLLRNNATGAPGDMKTYYPISFV